MHSHDLPSPPTRARFAQTHHIVTWLPAGDVAGHPVGSIREGRSPVTQPLLLLAAVIFIAAVLQTLTGFGFALLVMPAGTLLLGIRTAAPLVALVALALYATNLLRYRQALAWDELGRLAGMAALGVPAGIWLLRTVDEGIITAGLGLLLAAYALYSLARPAVLHPIGRGWAYPLGFAVGCLGGAYNIPGPPVILYGSLRQWPHDSFRAVLQALFLISGSLVVAGHALSGEYAGGMLATAALLVLPLLLGSALGARLDRRLAPQHLRTFVTAFIFVLGLTLLF